MSHTFDEYDQETVERSSLLKKRLLAVDTAIGVIRESKSTQSLRPLIDTSITLNKSLGIKSFSVKKNINKITTNCNDKDRSFVIQSNLPQLMICPQCGDEISTSSLRFHEQYKCKETEIKCPEFGCNMTMRSSLIKKHLSKECPIAINRRRLILKSEFRKEKDAKDAIFQTQLRSIIPSNVVESVKLNDETVEVSPEESSMVLALPCNEMFVSCPSCDETCRQSKFQSHTKYYCKMRMIFCSNRCLGCTAEVSLANLQAHLDKECPAEIKKMMLIEKALHRREIVSCSGCGEMMELVKLREHELKICNNRKFACRNAHLGCPVMLRKNDMKYHERVDGTKAKRCCLYLEGDGARLAINENDIECSWTVEYWIYRPPVIESAKCCLRNMKKQIYLYSDCFRAEEEAKIRTIFLTKNLKTSDRSTPITSEERRELVNELASNIRQYEECVLKSVAVSQILQVTIDSTIRLIREVLQSFVLPSEKESNVIFDSNPPGYTEYIAYLEAQKKRRKGTGETSDIERPLTGTGESVERPFFGTVPLNDIVEYKSDESIDLEYDLTSADENVKSPPKSIPIDIDLPTYDPQQGKIYTTCKFIQSICDTTGIWLIKNIPSLIKVVCENNGKISWMEWINVLVDLRSTVVDHDDDILRIWREESGLLQPTKLTQSDSAVDESIDIGDEKAVKAKERAKEKEMMKKRRETKKLKLKESLKGNNDEVSSGAGKLSIRMEEVKKGVAGIEVLAVSSSKSSTGNRSKICLDMNGNVGIVTIESSKTGGSDTYAFPATVPREKWTHIAITCTKEPKNLTTLYINGLYSGQVSDFAFALPMASIGGVDPEDGISFSGAILDVRYWRKIRSAIEIDSGRHKLIDMVESIDSSHDKNSEQPMDSIIDLTSDRLVIWYPFEESVKSHNVYDATEFRFKTPIMGASCASPGFRWLYADLLPHKSTKDGIIPVPSYKLRNICIYEIRRVKLAEAGRALQIEVICPSGCGESIRKMDLRFHSTYTCNRRMICCRFESCNAVFPILQQLEHEKTFCVLVKHRNQIITESVSNNSLIPCRLCSEPVKRKDIESHLNNDCPHRIVTCPNLDCSITFQAHSLSEHLKYSCSSSLVKQRLFLVQKARERTNYPRPWGIEIKDVPIIVELSKEKSDLSIYERIESPNEEANETK